MRADEDALRRRLVAIREALRLSQAELVSQLNAVSRALYGDQGPVFNQGRVSKLEVGTQRASLDDVAIYALLDPERRGKLWLAWHERQDRAMETRPTPVSPAPEPVGEYPLGQRPPRPRPATRKDGKRRRA